MYFWDDTTTWNWLDDQKSGDILFTSEFTWYLFGTHQRFLASVEEKNLTIDKFYEAEYDISDF